MKRIAITLTALSVLLLLALPSFAQDFIADGYTQIFERNTFETAPYASIVADEVHAGFDLDKDGNLEFIFIADHSNPNGPGPEYTDGHSLYVYEWDASVGDFTLMWSWADTSLKTGGASFPTMAIADLDGDSNQEIVLGMPSGTNWPAEDISPTVIYVFEFGTEGGPAEPTVTWTANTAPGSNTRPSGMAAGDIDGDGVMEVAVSFRKFSTASTNDAMMIFSVDGGFAGPFTLFKTEMLDTTSDVGSVYAVDITDIDNDGKLEAYFSTDNHHTFEATGPDAYQIGTLASPTVGPWTIQGTAEADVDSDGKNELVFGKTNGSLALWYGVTDVANSDSTNEAIIKVVEPGGIRGLTAGDYDGDGNTDIFVGGNFTGSVWRVEYKGAGAITDSNSYTYEKVYQDTVGEPRAYSVSFPGDNFAIQHGGNASTDMNGNGKPEFLIAYEAGDSLTNWIVMVEGDGVTSIEIDPGRQVLKSYSLKQNYPNPFNPSTTISYQLPSREDVSLKIYNTLGKEVKTLVDGTRDAGLNFSVWDGTNNAGNKVVSGIYIYRLSVAGHQLHKRMTLIK